MTSGRSLTSPMSRAAKPANPAPTHATICPQCGMLRETLLDLAREHSEFLGLGAERRGLMGARAAVALVLEQHRVPHALQYAFQCRAAVDDLLAPLSAWHDSLLLLFVARIPFAGGGALVPYR